MLLLEHQRDLLLNLGGQVSRATPIDEASLASLILLGLVGIEPTSGRPALTDSGRVIYKQLLDSGSDPQSMTARSP